MKTKVKKTTKKEIKGKTFKGGCFGKYTCQLEAHKNYTAEPISGKVYKNDGPSTYDTGYTVRNKMEFIDAVYKWEN